MESRLAITEMDVLIAYGTQERGSWRYRRDVLDAFTPPPYTPTHGWWDAIPLQQKREIQAKIYHQVIALRNEPEGEESLGEPLWDYVNIFGVTDAYSWLRIFDNKDDNRNQRAGQIRVDALMYGVDEPKKEKHDRYVRKPTYYGVFTAMEELAEE